MVLKMELAPPNTLNSSEYNAQRDAFLQKYRAERTSLGKLVNVTMSAVNPEALNAALKALGGIGFSEALAVADLIRLNPVDDYEQELVIMAEVSAYFQIAYKVRSQNSRLGRMR